MASHPQDGGAAAPTPGSSPQPLLPPRSSRPVPPAAPAAGLGPGSRCALLQRAGGPGPSLSDAANAPPPQFPGLHLLLTINLSAFSCSTASAGSIIARGHWVCTPPGPPPWCQAAANAAPESRLLFLSSALFTSQAQAGGPGRTSCPLRVRIARWLTGFVVLELPEAKSDATPRTATPAVHCGRVAVAPKPNTDN